MQGSPWDSSRIRAVPFLPQLNDRATIPEEAHGPSVWGGEYTREKARSVAVLPTIPLGVSSPDGPPKYSGTVRGSRRAFSPISRTFLGDILVVVELYSQLTTCLHEYMFFFR